jgi:AraC family transcriptional regulator
MKQENFYSYQVLYASDLYCINDFNSYSGERHLFDRRATSEFCINITRTGCFTYHAYRKDDEEYSSRVLIEKPGCEFRVIQEMPGTGQYTIINFTEAAYEIIRDQYGLKNYGFFSNPDIFCDIFTASPEVDYVHHRILKAVQTNHCRLEIDSLVTDLVDLVMQQLTIDTIRIKVPNSTKKYHLSTVEKAKAYLLENLTTDISLNELARHCNVSPFYFTRLFKQVCTFSPFYYLQQLRLKYAEILIRTTDLPITDICYRSGFNRNDYFSSAFNKKFELSPSRYKSKVLR